MNIVVFVTAKDTNEANKISKVLVEEKLAACVNIVKGVRSFFWWEGKVDKASETFLVIKTKRSAFKKLEKAVRSVHSYDVPEIIAIPIITGNKKYMEWIRESVR